MPPTRRTPDERLRPVRDAAAEASPSVDPACLDLDDQLGAVRTGRRFVQHQVLARGGAAFLDDAALVAGELLANARQHGAPPVSVCVSGHGDLIRVEVRDSSSRSPVRPAASTSNMTGRGLALIDALATRWGVDRRLSGGKAVWAEFHADVADAGDLAGVAPGDPTASAQPVEWDDDPSAAGRFAVVLGDVPTDLLIEAKAHMDNLVRELSLAGAAATGRHAQEVPEDFRRLIETVVNSFGEARDAIKRQALAAARRGDQRTRLTLHLPISAATAGEAYLRALDDADAYSRAARLLTLETPPDHRLFRRWYVTAVVEQLRELASGGRAPAVVPFEDLLVAEIRRLSSAQRVAERAARLQRVTAALAQTRTPEDVAAVVVSEGVDALGASGGSLLVPSVDGRHLAVPGALGYEDVLVDALREEPLDAPLPAATALRTGETVWLESREERDREFPALRGFEAATVSMCAVPLVAVGRVLGALRFSFGDRRLFDEDERGFVLALAAQTAQTLQRTELYEAERRAAVDLQRALLPSRVPDVPGWSVATHYSPAGDQDAGGDFYDVLPVGGGRFVAMVGDVMGRGIDAAASMAQVRSTVRAYAIEDPDPVRVFTRVDAFFEALDLQQLVTMLYLLVDPSDGTVRVGNAGHVPPLVVDGEGCRPVPTQDDMPFGVLPMTRRSSTVRLARGSSLVLITDGLVERRGQDIDDSVLQIARAIDEVQPADAESLLTCTLSAAPSLWAHDDDVTVLVLRRDP